MNNLKKLSVLVVLLAILALLLNLNVLACGILILYAGYIFVLIYQFSIQPYNFNKDYDYGTTPVSNRKEIRFMPLVLSRGNVLPISAKNADAELWHNVLCKK